MPTLTIGAVLALLSGCTEGEGDDTGETGESGEDPCTEDTTGPVIEHDPVETATLGEDVVIEARVTDESAVIIVGMYSKRETSATWSTGSPLEQDERRIHLWRGSIPGVEVTGGGMDYFLYAVDACNNESFLPEATMSPFHFRVDGG